MFSERMRSRRLLLIALSLSLALVYGISSQGLFAQAVSYAPGVEGQIWQQLPTFGRGVDMGNERPITIGALPAGPTFSTPAPLDGLADIWPCTVDPYGFPALCYSSGVIGSGEGAAPDVMQTYGGRFAPCVGSQCYPSGLIGVGSPVTWAIGPCSMQSSAVATDCFPSGEAGIGARVAPADGQLAGPLGIAVDNTPNVGTIYVTDHWNHRVQAFLFDGTVVPLTNPIGNGIAGTGLYTGVVNGQPVTGELLSYPESIKVDASRNLVVADSGNSRIAVFDTKGLLTSELIIDDPNGGPSWPTGVAMTPGATLGGASNPPNARLVVTDKYNCTVYFFDATSLVQVGIAGGVQCADTGGTMAFNGIAVVEGATIDSAGHVYVADYERNRVEIFDGTGTLLGAFGDPLAGAVPPFALSGPTDVMVDHRGVYTETDAQGTHQVARVFVVDTLNQRISVYKVNFDQLTPVATFLFELNAAGDLNGFPSNIAEDISRDAVGKLVVTDSGNARIQRFQVPDLAVVNVVPRAATQTVFFDVVVAAGKDAVGVTSVTPIVCPTSLNTTVTSGVAAPQAGCAAARSLTPTALILPGQKVTYSFQYVSGVPTATFDIFATGNPLNNVPQTTSNVATATAVSTCPTCSITPQVIVPVGTPEALIAPVSPSTLYVGARIYTTQVFVRLRASSAIGLSEISYRFISGPETANNAQPGVYTVTVSGTSAFVDVPFRLQGTSVVEYWAKNVDGTEIAHGQAQLTLVLVPPSLTFRFDLATSSNATSANAAGWWNTPVALPMDFTGHITTVTSLTVGMPARPPLSSPLSFATEGRGLGYRVTVADNYGLTTTQESNNPLTEGIGINLDITAPTLVKNATITLERASYNGAPPPAGTAAAMLALATEPALTNGAAGSGLVSVAPAAVLANFPFGTTTQSLIATDLAGNARSGSVSVRVLDTVKPVLTGPATLTINPGALGNIFATMPGYAVSDASMIGAPTGVTPVVVTQSVSAAQILAVGSVTPVTLTATDPSGNTATLLVSVTARLLTPPHFTRVPPSQTVEGGSPIDLLATAVDVLGASIPVTSNAPAVFPLGSTTVTFTATDSSNQTITATAVITVVDTKAPVITACAAPKTVFVVAGVASAYPALTGLVATDYSGFTVTQSPAAGTAYTLPIGQSSTVFNVTLTATDNSPSHHASTCVTTVTFSASSTPVCDAGNAGGDLWPPNHKLRTLAIRGITNTDGKEVTTKVTSIFQDEPTQGLGDGDTPIDGYISAAGVAQVRAERSGLGNGRVYYINFTATSTSGSFCTGTTTVAVPHDQAHAAVGGGPLYDSTRR